MAGFWPPHLLVYVLVKYYGALRVLPPSADIEGVAVNPGGFYSYRS